MSQCQAVLDFEYIYKIVGTGTRSLLEICLLPINPVTSRY